jgi:arsenate reductase-like glutaredoxin family protein
LKEWNVDDSFDLQDIKSDKMTPAQVDQLIKMSGSALALFSKRAVKYRAMGLHEKELSEADMRQLIIDEYTFLSRPVFIFEDQIFVGNSKKVVEAAKQALLGQ